MTQQWDWQILLSTHSTKLLNCSAHPFAFTDNLYLPPYLTVQRNEGIKLTVDRAFLFAQLIPASKTFVATVHDATGAYVLSMCNVEYLCVSRRGFGASVPLVYVWRHRLLR